MSKPKTKKSAKVEVNEMKLSDSIELVIDVSMCRITTIKKKFVAQMPKINPIKLLEVNSRTLGIIEGYNVIIKVINLELDNPTSYHQIHRNDYIEFLENSYLILNKTDDYKMASHNAYAFLETVPQLFED